MAEFSRPQYGVDVLKVEVPVNMKYVSGTRAYGGTEAYTRQDAMRLFREAASAARKPFIYLSAGVSNAVFLETLELAAEAQRRSPASSAGAPPGRRPSRSSPGRGTRP